MPVAAHRAPLFLYFVLTWAFPHPFGVAAGGCRGSGQDFGALGCGLGVLRCGMGVLGCGLLCSPPLPQARGVTSSSASAADCLE